MQEGGNLQEKSERAENNENDFNQGKIEELEKKLYEG
jgi:hypothetical protein